jgi:eukaryotic-like serine/threonine-protein kinase
VVDGVVYAGSGTGFRALDAATGELRWGVSTLDLVRTTPAVAGGVVYVGAGNGRLYALDAATGASVWTATTGGGISDPVTVAGGTVYARAYDGNAYAFDAATGAARWTTSIGNSQFAINPGPGGGGRPGDRHRRPRRQAVRPRRATGAVLWNVNPGARAVGTPAVAGGRVYVNLGGHSLRALDPATGAVLWSDATAVRSTSNVNAVVVANGAIYGSRSNGVTAHHP